MRRRFTTLILVALLVALAGCAGGKIQHKAEQWAAGNTVGSVAIEATVTVEPVVIFAQKVLMDAFGKPILDASGFLQMVEDRSHPLYELQAIAREKDDGDPTTGKPMTIKCDRQNFAKEKQYDGCGDLKAGQDFDLGGVLGLDRTEVIVYATRIEGEG